MHRAKHCKYIAGIVVIPKKWVTPIKEIGYTEFVRITNDAAFGHLGTFVVNY